MSRSGNPLFYRSNIRDHFVLEWKSTLKIGKSTLKTVIQATTLWLDSTILSVDFHSKTISDP